MPFYVIFISGDQTTQFLFEFLASFIETKKITRVKAMLADVEHKQADDFGNSLFSFDRLFLSFHFFYVRWHTFHREGPLSAQSSLRQGKSTGSTILLLF